MSRLKTEIYTVLTGKLWPKRGYYTVENGDATRLPKGSMVVKIRSLKDYLQHEAEYQAKDAQDIKEIWLSK